LESNTLERWYTACLIVSQGNDEFSLKHPKIDLGFWKEPEPQQPLNIVDKAKKEIAAVGVSLKALASSGLFPVWVVEWEYSHSYMYEVKNKDGLTLASFNDPKIITELLESKKNYDLTVETLDELGCLIDTKPLSDYFFIES
jgi:hypothetical protein